MGTIKIIHIACAALSFLGFFTRGIWMLTDCTVLQQKWVKITPHVVDSILLASAIALAVQYSLSPLAHPWLLAKIIALLLYIYLGLIALKRGSTKPIRTIAWVAAMVVFIYIVSVARSKTAWGFVSVFF